ncbi:MAG: glycosyltransferase family 1 protein [Proteobacteria bacterium]|nr:glycosyltransferase family 1 protein [Pseudomonadota bacterium]
MKVLINCIPLLTKLTGVGVYTLELSKKLLQPKGLHEYIFYYGYASSKLFTFSGSRKSEVVQVTKKIFKNIPCGRRIIKNIFNNIRLRDVDLYFEPNFIPNIKIKTRATVTTVHDFSFTVREWTPKDRYEFFNENFFKEIYKSHIIISPSEFIKKEVLDKLTFPEERVVTIHHGIDHAVFNQNHTDYAGQNSLRGNIKKLGNYLLFVGTIQPRKNLKGLIHAYTLLPAPFQKDFKLLLVGFEGWNHKDINETIMKNKNIHVFDSVSNNDELAELYRSASLFVFPSFYEGFGFPPLEAMACGCPVVVSNTSSLPEVCGDAAYYIDSHNVESIANGILRVTEDENLRKKLIQKGLERVKLFTWETSAQKHREVFERALGL